MINDHHQNGHTPIDRELIERGYVLAVYNRTDLAPDQENDPRRPPGSARLAYPQYDWATLAIWAWGGMRVLDYLETLALIDPAKIVITGHSRGGKVALLAGALDQRFALVVANGSGCGGTGSFRVQSAGSETLAAITDPKRFSYWFHPRLRTFAGQVDRLPLDQHYLRALVALAGCSRPTPWETRGPIRWVPSRPSKQPRKYSTCSAPGTARGSISAPEDTTSWPKIGAPGRLCRPAILWQTDQARLQADAF